MLSSMLLSSPGAGLRFPVPPTGWSMALGVRLWEQGLAAYSQADKKRGKKRRQEEDDTTL